MSISSQGFLIFYLFFLLLAVFERITNTFFQSEIETKGKIYYKWTFSYLLYVYLFIVLFSIGEFIVSWKEINLSVSIIGIVIYGFGAFIRRKAINDLGDNWSVYIEIKKNQELITDGIYKVMRHPYCLAVILELLGACLIANAFYSSCLVFLIQGPLLLVRIMLEEKVLIMHFGNSYLAYRKLY